VEELLTTKLYIPATRPELVPRPRLIERLNEGIRQNQGFGRRLTLISAPAGFGKTTLVAEWVAGFRLKVESSVHSEQHSAFDFQPVFAWLSLDEGDNDPTRFLSYFIAALKRIEGIDLPLEKTLSMIQSPQPRPTETILVSLINEMAAINARIIFVLDDYHLIDAQPIHGALSFLLENMPPQMHLVMATREDPQLPLARLRAQGQLAEIRAADLRFSSAEAAEFLNQVMGLDLSTEDVAALETRTEGWIAGLQLAAISLQGHADTSRLIRSFTGSHRLVLDYLIEEVLNQQPQNVQDFLFQTAILDRLSGSLCDAVRLGTPETPSGQNNGQMMLEMLERANLFVVPLDNERQWYRYHHLFADLLRQRLRQTRAEQVPMLHLRASEWYEQKNLPSDAIRHALAAGDFERAADLAEVAWPAWSESFYAIAWLGWVKELPEELVRARPVLSLAYAQAFLNAGKLEDAEIKLKNVERWLEPRGGLDEGKGTPATEMVVVDKEQFRSLPSSLAMARTYHAQALGDVGGTLKYGGQALDLLPEDDHYNRAAVTGLLGLAYWASGDLEAANRTFSDGLFQNDHDVIKGTFVLADMKMTLGNLHEAISACERALQLANEHGEPMLIGTEDVYTGISGLHREQGNLEAAAQDLAISKKLGEQVELPDWQYRWCIAQARLKETLGDLDGALDLLDEAERLYVRTPLPEVRPIAAMRTRAWVKQGRLTEALGWARERGLSVDDDLSYLREFEHVTLARVLIARYKRDHVDNSIHEVVGLLERLLKAAEEGGRMGSVIEILALQALAFEARGNIPSALKSLERALRLAEPEGYVRIFVDEGPAMGRLLYEALGREISPAYVSKLLADFSTPEAEQSDSSQTQAPQPELVEPLSEREIEVLQLIAEGLTNPEIGTRLYLSLNTVKVHTRNIYGKLGVNKRTQAVARARALGILASI
jgi:LuxR family maltose regulon positive regulatory protein